MNIYEKRLGELEEKLAAYVKLVEKGKRRTTLLQNVINLQMDVIHAVMPIVQAHPPQSNAIAEALKKVSVALEKLEE